MMILMMILHDLIASKFVILNKAYIIEKAGGLATTGTQRVLDIHPKSIHERVPIFLGSREDDEEVIELYKKHSA